MGRTTDARETARPKRVLNITPETGGLLWILLKTVQATRVLEVGTSNGYSTIWLADAVRLNRGRVISLERDAAKVMLARENLRRAGLLETVEIRERVAANLITELPGPLDVVFLDADREHYLDYLELVVPKLRSGGLLVADNATSHATELAAYLAAAAAGPQLFSVTVPIGNGEQIAVKH